MSTTSTTATTAIQSQVTTGPLRRTMLILALPVLGEQILNTLVGLVDTWLAGSIDAVAISAVGIAAYVAWLASMIVMLVGTGTTALVSRHKGAGLDDEANRDTNQSMTLALVIGAGVLLFLYGLAPTIARFLSMSGESFDITVRYLRIDAMGHVFMSLTIVASAALRGVGDMRTPMLLYALINVVNIVVSCTLVFHYQLGVTGIVTGTVVARIIGGVVAVGILLRGRSGLMLVWNQLGVARARTWRILRIGIPAAADGAIMWTGHFIFLAIVARVASGAEGQASLAAHIIAIRVEALSFLPAVAWGTVTATMIGQALGANKPQRAERAGYEAILQGGSLAILLSAVFFFGAGWIFTHMSNDALVYRIGVPPFRILALLQVTLLVAIVFIWGLRGAGDTRFPLLITTVGIIMRLAVGYYFGIVRQGGLMGAWYGMFTDMTWRMGASTWRYARGRWLKTKV